MDCLMPSDNHNSMAVKAYCSALLQPERCLLAYQIWTYQCPHMCLITFAHNKNINLVVVCDGFLYVTEIIRILHSGYFHYIGASRKVLNL